jgi:hypothetical protein
MKKKPPFLPRFADHLDSTPYVYSKKSLSPFPPSLADSDLDGPWCAPGKEDRPRSHLDFQSLVIAAYELWCEEEWLLIEGLGMVWGSLYALTCLVGVIKLLAMRWG